MPRGVTKFFFFLFFCAVNESRQPSSTLLLIATLENVMKRLCKIAMMKLNLNADNDCGCCLLITRPPYPADDFKMSV